MPLDIRHVSEYCIHVKKASSVAHAAALSLTPALLCARTLHVSRTHSSTSTQNAHHRLRIAPDYDLLERLLPQQNTKDAIKLINQTNVDAHPHGHAAAGARALIQDTRHSQ